VTVDESDIISEARRKTASRGANSGDDFTDSTKTAYTLTEWSVSVTSPNRWMSTPGVWDGAPNAILNVHKTVDEPNEFGGIGKSVKHPEYDGLTFDSVDEAWAFAESKGLVSKRGSKTAAPLSWDPDTTMWEAPSQEYLDSEQKWSEGYRKGYEDAQAGKPRFNFEF